MQPSLRLSFSHPWLCLNFSVIVFSNLSNITFTDLSVKYSTMSNVYPDGHGLMADNNLNVGSI